MSDYPLVSIVMPVYNTADFLRNTLDSIIAQTYTNWELIAVDDHSTDTSLDILVAYAQDHNIKIFKNSKKGILPALALAEHHASGHYITRMDSDDLMAQDRIQTMVAHLQDQNHAVAVGKVSYFTDEEQLGGGYLRYETWLNELIDHNNHYTQVYKECVIPSPCWMMRLSDLKTIGGFDDSRYPEDYDLVFRMYRHNIKVIGIDKVLLYWRDHTSRTSRNDDRYSDQSFLPLKIHHFIEHDRNTDRPLVIWGAGKAGKSVAKSLSAHSIDYHWITENESKHGHNIYGTIVKNIDLLDELASAQIITAVRQPDFLHEIKSKEQKWTEQKGHTFYHFH